MNRIKRDFSGRSMATHGIFTYEQNDVNLDFGDSARKRDQQFDKL